jgi:RHS repeat-associated protein
VATYSHPDILGSTIALSNATASPVGALSAAFNYDPFGQPVVPLTSTFGYAGQRLEQTTGLIYDGARFYSPAWGRFYSPDPIGYAGGNNLYAYVGNDPLNNTDPFGLAAQQVGSSQWNLTTAYSQSDLDQLNTRLTSARLKGDQNLINQILAEIDNFGDAALATTTVVNSAASGTGPYTVGPYNVIKGTFPGYDAHHVGQKALMLQLIAGYNPDTAPSILVPKVGHTIRGPNGIVSRSTEGLATPRDVLARDISELRRVYPDIPNEKLQELIQLNKGAYPEAFKK